MYMHLTVRLWFQNFPKSLNEYDLQGKKKKDRGNRIKWENYLGKDGKD